ncbi:DNRLRE domain-containing protein [Streptomyces sp. NPDC096094]|uniref:DNRLRE domain-containing protein n=1 Tax=Streptomyces sp. NPDC096094 TaxID=3366073 RepID=UPI0037FDD592
MSPYRQQAPRRRARFATGVALLLVAETALVAGASLPAGAAPAAEPDDRRSVQPSKDEILAADIAWAAAHAKGSKAWAITQAKRTGKKVVVADETTATTYTVANPDGTLTTELTTGPERVWRDGKWHKVDVTLTAGADGAVRAKNHPEGLRLAGKTGKAPASLSAAQQTAPKDLVTLGSGEQAVTLQWKGGLPKPELDGTTARYSDAVPGADVIVEASRTGFEQYVEIAQKPSVDGYSYTLPVKAKGLVAEANKDGSVSFTDAETGVVRATMPAPVMWDASVDQRSGKHENRARVGMKVVNKGQGVVDLVVTPDADFLADPETQYPVTVDPSTSALGNLFDTYVQRGETVDWSGDTELDLGNPGTKNGDGTYRTARSFITWNTAPIADALVSKATLSLWNFHSGNTDCTAQPWEVWTANNASTSSRWTNQPAMDAKYATSTATRGNPGCTATDGWITADVTTLAQYWAGTQWGHAGMGLRASSESDTHEWKRVNSANNAANQPKLTVTYNFRPGDGTAQQAGAPFKSYAGVWAVNTTTPTLRDKFTDADGDQVNGTFQVYDAATNKPITTPAGEGLIVSDYAAPGEWASVKVPAGQLVDGRTYKFRTNSYDGSHYNLNWSPWRQFVVDTTAPGEPASIASPTYPADGNGGGAGVAGAFNVDTGDTGAREIRYRLDGELPEDTDPGVLDGIEEGEDNGSINALRAVAPEWQSAPTTGRTGSFSATPDRVGAHHVEVQTVDRADNVGTTGTYGFLAGGQVRTNHVVNIKLPDKPAYNDGKFKATGEWQLIPGYDTRAARFGRTGQGSNCTDQGDGTVTCANIRPVTGKAEAWAKPTIVEEQLSDTPKGIRAAGELIPACSGINDDGTSNPDNALWGWFNRTEMCMAAYYEYYTYDKKTKVRLSQADFFIDVQIKVDAKSPDMKYWARIRPKKAAPPTPAMKNDIKIDFDPRCDFGCTAADTSFQWDGPTTWKGAAEYDSHEVTGSATLTWDVKNDQDNANGSGWDGKSRKDSLRQRGFPVGFIGPEFSGATTDDDTDLGAAADNLFQSRARCDFADIGLPPGCVFPEYAPGYVIKSNEFPAAAAHLFLIRSKMGLKNNGDANTGPGTNPFHPLHYLPMSDKKEHKTNQRNAWDRGPNQNRSKICGRSGQYGFVPHGLTKGAIDQYNHPKKDVVSCDEFSFNTTYESAGMPASQVPSGVTSHEVPNGAHCVQTYEGKAADGKIYLRDDGRYPEPDWTNIECGRSSMALSVNSGAMRPFGAFAKSYRMLDTDPFYIYAPLADLGCDDAVMKEIVTCEITDLDPDTIP